MNGNKCFYYKNDTCEFLHDDINVKTKKNITKADLKSKNNELNKTIIKKIKLYPIWRKKLTKLNLKVMKLKLWMVNIY